MPRLFTGLEMPAETAMMLSSLRGGLRNARWIDPENYHITLRFIGDIDDRTADEVAFALGRINRTPFEIRLGGLAAFGNKKPHSIYAAVAPNPQLAELQAEQERIIQRLGLPAERRKFIPHVTICRCKGSATADVARWLAMRGGFSAQPFIAGRFVLYSSKASTGGGPYLIEEAYPLAA
ncbi:RNA 2',3'-cyclic phosphodiesterase [Breoghania sp. L-A4]|uniref:RNA 2',3'-cyclic phosphodiesterase n=1 Tax=Breoghania sp. L-A4 TaxID=2304600 RepID=UPI000E358CA8|nr:RNA 2',3'-cyclic phosphodiesterase [Breoghania sp. L-A4]AXS42084.1 RNA 2',3'-cyclic phosphodiesterase [Breoghania sp. L-A4]